MWPPSVKFKVQCQDMRHLFNTAVQLHQQGKLNQAERLYRQILGKTPHQPDTLNALGILLTELGKTDEAVSIFHKAIQANYKVAHVHLNLGEALRAAKRYEDAATAINRALQIQPHYPEAEFCLGSLFHDQQQLAEATTCYRNAVKGAPTFAQAYNSLGIVLQECGELEESRESLLRAIKINANYPDAHFNLANTYVQLGGDILALKHYKECLRLSPEHSLAHCRLAYILMDISTVSDEQIQKHFDAAEKHLGKTQEFLSSLGKFRIRQGRIDEALDFLRESIELEPTPSALYDYAHSKRFKSEDAWFRNSADHALSIDAKWDLSNQALVNFAIGKMYDDIGEYDQAIKNYYVANSAIRETILYDREEEERKYSKQQMFFNSDFFTHQKVEAGNSKKLVFVVGMPRSGTSLTEQVLSSHSRIVGGGELPGISGIRTNLIEKHGLSNEFPDVIAYTSEDILQQVSNEYLNEIFRIFPGNYERLTDKLPHNFFNIGLIVLLFPMATIINVKRDPIDNCLSIYFQKFLRGHPYAYDLKDIGHQYLLYQKMMEHWHSVLPGRIMDLQYENLISDPERWSRKLIQHVGLQWDDACLTPHKLERTVKTASQWQVRQPIYKTSVQRWKNYEQHLGPLKEALGYED